MVLGTVGVTLKVGPEIAVTNIDVTNGPRGGAPISGARFNDNGSIDEITGTIGSRIFTQIHGGEWFINEPQAGIGSSYDIRVASMAVGFFDGGASVGVWAGLETNPQWTEQRTGGKGGEGPGTDTATGNMEIRDGNTLVVVATFTLKATAIKA